MIRNQGAYDAAVSARIRNNANLTRSRKFNELLDATDGTTQEFRSWLGMGVPFPTMDALRTAANVAYESWPDDGFVPKPDAIVAYEKAWKSWTDRVGYCPQWLTDARRDWGGLTVNQLGAALKIFAGNIARHEGREQERAAKRATAVAWTAGRQSVTGTVLSVVTKQSDFGTVFKMMVETPDGARLWVTQPSTLADADRGDTVTMMVAVEPSADDATFAFGKRPTKAMKVAA